MTAAAIHYQETAALIQQYRANLLAHQEKQWRERYGEGYAESVTRPAWPALSSRYMQIAQREGYQRANRYANDYAPLIRADLYLADSDAGIRAFCDQRVTECRGQLQAAGPTPGALRACSRVLDRYGMDWPAPVSPITGPSVDLWPLAARLMCARWWRRQVRRLQCRVVDQLARERQKVAKYREVYCSDWAVRNRWRAEQRNARALEAATAVNDEGQEYTLAELAALGTSNMALRRNELMTRMRGFEEVATARGHVGEFWTFTAASRWHRMRWLKKPGKAVPVKAWNESTPRDVQDHLCRQWEKIRAALDREGIRIYGFRLVEPHHDGTPHWHLLVFMRECDARKARKICRHYLWWMDAPHEKNSRAIRFDAKRIDPARGSAAGYVAKYVAKNIDGEGVRGALHEQDDDSGLDMKSAAVRVRAWSSVWGIRQFQQIGGPSVTVWRELRRLWAADEPSDDGDMFGSADTYRAGCAANDGDWAAYVEAMGGPDLPRADRPCKPGYWIEYQSGEQVNTETGEVETRQVCRETTAYGDPAKGQIFGLIIAQACGAVLTRFYRWVVRWADPPGPIFAGHRPALDLCQ